MTVAELIEALQKQDQHKRVEIGLDGPFDNGASFITTEASTVQNEGSHVLISD